jgi:hypothetical protein
MKAVVVVKRLLGLMASTATLAACSSGLQSQAPFTQPALTQFPAVRSDEGANLLYVSYPGINDVDMYVYANGTVGKRIGSIDTPNPTGLCTDKAGDVYVVSNSGDTISKFAHGATLPVRTIKLAAGYPYACAVDLSSGDLAVSVENPHGKTYKGGEVHVYPGGQLPFKDYKSFVGFHQTSYVAYDDKHDLFVVASPCQTYYYCQYDSQGAPPALFELTPGARWFERVHLKHSKLVDPAGIAWINPTLLVTDNNYKNKQRVFGLKVFVQHRNAAVIETIPLTSTQNAQGVAVRAGVAIVADGGGDAVRNYSLESGRLLSTLKDKTGSPSAAVISQGK